MILMTMPGGRCHAQLGGDTFVAERFHDVLLVDQGGKVRRTIRRKPNGNWLDILSQVALGTDGSIAILSDLSVDLYESNGDPIRTIPLPEVIGRFPRFTYDGNHLVIAAECGMLLLDKTGNGIGMLTTAQWEDPKNEYWTPFLIDDSRELLLFDGGASRVYRYKMP